MSFLLHLVDGQRQLLTQSFGCCVRCLQGYGATLLSFGPYSAFYFLFYEQVRAVESWKCQTPCRPPPLRSGILVVKRWYWQFKSLSKTAIGGEKALPFHYILAR